MKPIPKNKKFFILAGLLVASTLAYLPVMKGDFLADEYLLILKNPLVQHPPGLKYFFLEKFWPGKVQDIYYRPVVILSYAGNWWLGRTSPLGYHLFNLFFHFGNMVLVYLLFRRWFSREALLAVVLFGLHPVLTEAVAKISGRTDLLASFFLLLSWHLWFYAEGKRGIKLFVIYLTISLSFLFSVFSKELGIMLPVYLLLGDWYRSSNFRSFYQTLRSHLTGYIFILGALLFYLWLRHQALQGISVSLETAFISGFSLWEKPFVISRILLEYLRLLIFPYPLAPDYLYTEKFARENYPFLLMIFSGIFWVVILFFLLWGFWRKNLVAGLGIFWLLSLVPVSHLIPIPPALAERFLYLSCGFYAMILSVLIYYLAGRFRRVVWGNTLVILLLFFLMTFFSSSLYQDWERSYRDAVRKVPSEKIFHNLLGLDYLERKDYKRAQRQFIWALHLDPNYPEALVNLGILEYLSGVPEKALNLFKEAIKLSPDYGEAHYNLGKILANLGEFESAEEELKRAMELEPENPGPVYALAVIAEKQNNLREAKQWLDATLRLANWHLPALKARTRIALQENDLKLAKELLQRWQRLDPQDPELKKILERFPP